MTVDMFLPQCTEHPSEHGGFHYKQCSAGQRAMCWCVDEYGEMVERTMTSGQLTCDSGGEQNGGGTKKGEGGLMAGGRGGKVLI